MGITQFRGEAKAPNGSQTRGTNRGQSRSCPKEVVVRYYIVKVVLNNRRRTATIG